jgi:hypothetical protein
MESKGEEFVNTINRNTDVETIIDSFVRLWNENQNTALKILAHLRNPRGGGKGEKFVSQILLFFLKIVKNDIYEIIAEEFCNDYGCWKDLLVICELGKYYPCDVVDNEFELGLFETQLKEDIQCLSTGDNISLAAKWAPSEKTYFNKPKLLFANKLANRMNMTPRDYRKMLTNLRAHLKVVEVYMSTDRWEKIEFGDIPVIAHKNYCDALISQTNSQGVTSESRMNCSLRYVDYLLKKNDNESERKFEDIVNEYELNIEVDTSDYISIRKFDKLGFLETIELFKNKSC